MCWLVKTRWFKVRFRLADLPDPITYARSRTGRSSQFHGENQGLLARDAHTGVQIMSLVFYSFAAPISILFFTPDSLPSTSYLHRRGSGCPSEWKSAVGSCRSTVLVGLGIL